MNQSRDEIAPETAGTRESAGESAGEVARDTASGSLSGDPARRRMTLREVAAVLRVSPMTVSNAYNRPDQISAATRARVLAEAARLGYTGPHPTARSLRRGRAGVVGMLYAGPLSYAFSDPAAVLFLQGVSLATEAAHLGLLLLSGASEDDPAVVKDAAIDGLIVLAMAEDDPLLRAATSRTRSQPLVLVDQAPLAGVPGVGIDDEGGARAAAAHLLALGHRHVGIIALGQYRGHSGPLDLSQQDEIKQPVTRARLRGYTAALAAAGVSLSPLSLYACATLTPAEGKEAALWLCTRPDQPRPTALLVMSDQLALGALEAAHALGLSVPGDLSIVGFDDIPEAARADPPLTTIHQPHVEKGRLAASLLIENLAGGASSAAPPGSHVLPTTLVVRGTTAPAPPPSSI